jgi:hypothetical protein
VYIILVSKAIVYIVAVAVAVIGRVVKVDSIEVRRGSKSYIEC